MGKQQQNTMWKSALSSLSNSAEGSYLFLVVAGVFMFLAGASELPQIAIGHPPSSVYGLWASVVTVFSSGIVANQFSRNSPSLRLENYGGPPVHWPSILSCSTVGSFSFLLALDEPFLQSISMGLVAGLLSYLVVGRIWYASWRTEWDRTNAHIRRLNRYVVEGQAIAGGTWVFVGCVDDENALLKQRLQAHAQFEHVRYWRIESNVTLMESEAASNLVFATPLDASTMSEQEARSASRV